MKKNARKLEDLDWKFNLDRRKTNLFFQFPGHHIIYIGYGS